MASIESYTLTSGAMRYRVHYRDPEGFSQTKSGFATKRDANTFITRVENAKLDGEYIAPGRGRVTVGELGKRWMHIKSATMEKSGYRSYESAWRIHVEPRWSDTSVKAIDRLSVDTWIADLTKAGLGPNSVIRCHGVLHGILATAVDSRMITRNPASGAALPKVPKRSPIHLTGEQLEAFIAEAGAGKSTARRDGPAIVAVLGYCALRWGEIAALTPESLFQTRRGRWRFLVDRQDVTTGGEAVRTTPKTDDNRGVPIPERVMTLLRPIIDATAPGQRLFPAAGGRAMKPPGNDTWWSAAVERCQKADPEFPDVSPHKLRHTAISLAIYAGGSVLAVQRLAGHSSITTTYDRYGHLMADELDEVADAMDRAAERVTGKKYNENTTHPQNQDNFCKPQADAVKGK